MSAPSMIPAAPGWRVVFVKTGEDCPVVGWVAVPEDNMGLGVAVYAVALRHDGDSQYVAVVDDSVHKVVFLERGPDPEVARLNVAHAAQMQGLLP